MRKLILSLVFVLATGSTLMNANSNDELFIHLTKVTEVLEQNNCSDCVADSRAGALAMAEDHGDRGAGGELMELYGNFYTACRAARC